MSSILSRKLIFILIKNACFFLKNSIKVFQKLNLKYCVEASDRLKDYLIFRFMDGFMKSFVDMEYTGCKKRKDNIDDQNIWVLWLQGQDKMPEIVSLCYKNLNKNSNGHKVILLTKDNLGDFLEISPSILDRVGKTISYAAFSDYIRFNLLSLYGGLWIDSTYFVTKPLDDSIFKTELWTIHKPYPTFNSANYSIISKSRWTGNLIYASKNCQYIKLCRNLFCNYWLFYNESFDYFLIDDCIWYIYNSSKKFKSLIDSLPVTNRDSLSLCKAFNVEWDATQWKEWIDSTQFFKLTFKGIFIKEVNGKITNYGYIIRKYYEN